MEEVIEANTTPYLVTSEKPILQLVDDIRSKEDEECFTILLYECSDSLEEQQHVNEEELKVAYIDENPPQVPQVLTNKVMDDFFYTHGERIS
nr:hypothetical protein [Tanacetum cinerariifolium]